MVTLTAKDVMEKEVLAVQVHWSVDRLAAFLVENSISGAPVVSSSGKLVGVVSLTDIVRYRSLPVKNPETEGPHDYYLNGLELQYSPHELASFRVDSESSVTVRDIMTGIIFEVNQDTKIQQVADAMIRGRIHRVFVTRRGKLKGIITALDLLNVIRDL